MSIIFYLQVGVLLHFQSVANKCLQGGENMEPAKSVQRWGVMGLPLRGFESRSEPEFFQVSILVVLRPHLHQ